MLDVSGLDAVLIFGPTAGWNLERREGGLRAPCSLSARL
jgi:hypothetical protein